MSGISIITDSTADLSRELVARYGITVVPLTVVFGQDTYRDGADIDTKRLFELVEQNNELPKTSSPSPEVFRSVFEKAVADGRQALYIGISSRFSSSVQNDSLAAGTLPDGQARVFDSANLSTGIAQLVLTHATWSRRAGRWTRYSRRLRRPAQGSGRRSNSIGWTTCTWAEGAPGFRRCCRRC